MRYADWLLDLAIGGQNLHSMFEDLGIQFAQHADAVVPGFVDHDDVGPLAGVIAETKVVEQVPPRLAAGNGRRLFRAHNRHRAEESPQKRGCRQRTVHRHQYHHRPPHQGGRVLQAVSTTR